MKLSEALSQIFIRGIRMDNIEMDDALARIENSISSNQPTKVAFINADCVNIANRSKKYRTDLKDMDMVLVDGVGMRIAGKVLGKPVKDNVNGTDMFPKLCALLEKLSGNLFLLGASSDVVERVAIWVENNYPGVNVVGVQHGYFDHRDEYKVVERIRASCADVLLVALGVPLQEEWIARNMERSGVRIAMGVGGLFDFYSGRIPRAPLWMRRAGLEWTYRLLQEPGRMWKRYLVGNMIFLIRVFYERIQLGFRKEIA